MSTRWKWRGWLGCAVGVTLASSAIAAPASAGASVVPLATTTVQINPGTQYQTIQGWGTSLAWWAEGTGGWSSGTAKNALADALFSPTNGLGLNVIRYNIGATTPDDTCAAGMRTGAAVPSFEQSPGNYDWTQDPNQRWMLQAAQARGANVFEAIAYSAPAWMTIDDCSGGNTTVGADNLASSNYAAYAQYLANVVQHFHDSSGITFNTVEPFNEPVVSQWNPATDRQQAMNLGATARNAVIGDLQADLSTAGMTSYTGISATDELGVAGDIQDYNDYTAANKADLVQFNTHDYRAADGSPLYQLGQQTNTPVSMSEWGTGTASSDLAAGLTLSQHILTNEQQMHPSAWSIWQAVDGPNDGGNTADLWGLVYADISPGGNGALTFPKRYYVMGNYSKFVRPGYEMIGNSDANTFTAYDPASQTLVLVATNPGTSDEQVSYDLSNFASTGASATPYQTDATENLAALPAAAVSGGQLAVTLPAQSVTTYVLPNTVYPGVLPSSPAVQYGPQMQVFGRAASGTTYSDVYTPGSGWSNWQSLGGNLAADPTAVQYGNQMQVYGRAADGSTWSDVYTPGSGWSGWQSLGGNVTSDLTAMRYGVQLQVFGRAGNGSEYSDVYTPGSGWSGWQDLGGNLAGTPSVAVYGQQMFVFGRDSGGTPYVDAYTPGSGWSGWQSLGGNVTSDLTAMRYGAQLEVFGRAGNGSIYADVLTPGHGWSGWQDLGGTMTGNPSVVTYGNQLQVFSRDANGTTYSDVYTPGSGWSNWQSLGGTVVTDPTAVQYGVQMQVFARAGNGSEYSDVYTPGSGWSGWQNLGGNLA